MVIAFPHTEVSERKKKTKLCSASCCNGGLMWVILGVHVQTLGHCRRRAGSDWLLRRWVDRARRKHWPRFGFAM